MIEFPFSTAQLLQPIPLDTFRSRYYEREPLIIDRNSPSHYEGLMSLEALEDFLCATTLTSDDVLVVDDARDIYPEDYLRSDETIDAVRVQRLFDDGATISLRQMQNKVPALARLCRSAEQQFSCGFQANLYFSPPNAQGFKTHHDTHDVFILQVHGSKHWRSYEPVVPLPLNGQRFYWEKPPDQLQRDTFTLRPGDLFYCPRGMPHDARATQDASLHISLGAMVGTLAELFLEVVADVALRDPAFRASLPPGYATEALAPDMLEKTFQSLIERLQRQARPRHVLGTMADRFIMERSALIDGQARSLKAAAALSLDARVGGRPGVLYRISEQRKKLTLLCHSRQITFPRFVSASLRFALCHESFLVRELPGPLTDSAKLVLVRRLIREGLVIMNPG
jgi:ribosomal protein L16 Arg81 hydroxylase